MVWIGAIAMAMAAAVAAAVVARSPDSGGRGLLDRAVAAINVGDHHVLHELDIREEGPPGFSERLEGWLLPADGRARMIEIWGYKRSPFVSEWIVTATGRVVERSCLSYCHPASFIDGRAKWRSEGRVPVGTFGGPPWVPGTFERMFRAAHRAHALVPDGTARFDRERAAAFKSMETPAGQAWIAWRAGTPPPATARHRGYISFDALIDWYVDPAAARLLGFRAWGCTGDHVRACEARKAPPSTTRIVTFQQLDPSPQNLAKLTGPNAPPDIR